ncbi:MAG: DNA gyrase C-terminal beta-propeller domain-containing protein, partial [Nanoarchaeota archaeon]
NQPVIMDLKDVINYYVQHRKDVVTRRTSYELRKAEERAHILQGLQIALDNIDPVIKLVKGSKAVEDARNELMKSFNLTDIQANAVLDMKLQKLTSLETNKLKDEYTGLIKLIEELKGILSSEQKIFDIIKRELIELREQYGDKRRTEIVFDEEEGVEEEELIKEEDIVITLTHSGYIKQIPLTTYKKQKRGGVGVVGADVKEEDLIKNIFVTSNKNYLLIFTNKGKVHWLKAHQVPEGSRYARGKSIVNLIKVEKDEKVNAILPVSKFDGQHYIITTTKKGLIKKTSLDEYSNPRSGGIIGINLKNNDDVVEVKLTDGNYMLMIASKNGTAVKFNEKDVRSMGRNAAGVRGIKLVNNEVVGMEVILPGTTIFTITEKGYGKRTKEDEYRLTRRGGKGVTNIKITEKNGKVIGIKSVNDNDDLICMTKNGIVTRISVKDVSVIGRNTQGVRIMKLKEG